jgi:predicted aldo/keto reductase-like oxidoreductase
MQYRELGNSGLKVSEVGIGGEYLEFENRDTVIRTMHRAMEMGVNILDIFMSNPGIRTNLGLAIKDRRSDIIVQGHVCSVWENDQYLRTRDLSKSKLFTEDLFERLQTDYIDIGMLHYVDTPEDWKKTQESGVLEYMQELKKQGRFRMLGVSSHDANVAMELVKSGLFSVLMFSINPSFDLAYGKRDIQDCIADPTLPDHLDIDADRARLYALCEEKGVGITVMKALGAGRLLRAETSPFKAPMTVTQCIHYALTRPAVSSVLVGARSVKEIEEAVAYCDATEQERDFTGILKHIGVAENSCMYCNHCLPCPKHINIAGVTRLKDDGTIGMTAAIRESYSALDVKASACIECGACEKRCPFGVKIIENMRSAAQMFEA